MSRPNRRRILWTGGFDSTALVLQALKAGERVIPFYLRIDDGWQKQIRERDARGRIRQGIPEELRRLLEPDVEINVADVRARIAAIDRAIYNTRRHDYGLQPIKAADYSPQLPAILAMGEHVPDLEAGYVADDAPLQDPILRRYLKAFHVGLPLEHVRKVELLEWAERQGARQLLGLTWSCEGEIEEARTEPCGVCLPCRGRIIPQIVRAS